MPLFGLVPAGPTVFVAGFEGDLEGAEEQFESELRSDTIRIARQLDQGYAPVARMGETANQPIKIGAQLAIMPCGKTQVTLLR